jgi:hypothetical protein
MTRASSDEQAVLRIGHSNKNGSFEGSAATLCQALHGVVATVAPSVGGCTLCSAAIQSTESGVLA